jgi:hypothetical protein
MLASMLLDTGQIHSGILRRGLYTDNNSSGYVLKVSRYPNQLITIFVARNYVMTAQGPSNSMISLVS